VRQVARLSCACDCLSLPEIRLSLLKTPISRLLMLRPNGGHAATMYKVVGISGCEPPQPKIRREIAKLLSLQSALRSHPATNFTCRVQLNRIGGGTS
jgi:hypothetical protein